METATKRKPNSFTVPGAPRHSLVVNDEVRAQMRDYIREQAVVIPETGCWEWHPSAVCNHYGQITVNHASHGAHRVSYVAFHGPLPERKEKRCFDQRFICHKCNNRVCVNPEHIYLGNGHTNYLDSERTGTRRVSRGPAHAEAVRAGKARARERWAAYLAEQSK